MSDPGVLAGAALALCLAAVLVAIVRQQVMAVERALEDGLACGGVWSRGDEDLVWVYPPLQIGEGEPHRATFNHALEALCAGA